MHKHLRGIPYGRNGLYYILIVIPSGAEYENDGCMNGKTLCHSERSKYGNDGCKNNKALLSF